MQSNGAVICFQKYTLGEGLKTISQKVPDSPVCLGYFGRIEVNEVNDFKEYVRIASMYGAEQACSRKQLHIHHIDHNLDSEITIASKEHRENGGLPFCVFPETHASLCCCTALNISSSFLTPDFGLKEIALLLFNELNDIRCKNKLDVHFAVTGLLGDEDLCVIILSNRYDHISDAVRVIQELHCPDSTEHIIDNSHSILIMDTSGITQVDNSGWNNIHAEIHFSLKTVGGLNYLHEIKKKLDPELTSPNQSICIEGRTGEYDAVIRCPAELLCKELYGSNGLISYNNEQYQKIAYQSETIVYPFGSSNTISCSKSKRSVSATGAINMYDKVKNAVSELKRCFLGDCAAVDNDFDYIELALYRLLKDYNRISAFPYSIDLQDDFSEQFTAALNAIIVEANRCMDPGSIRNQADFNKAFDAIINAVSSSMQAASQFDRLNYGEQSSYLQNIGSYHKILRCYYGIIKDILKLLNSVAREATSTQPILIPSLSFGLTPIVTSSHYDSYYYVGSSKKDARLICIKLPYQALSNPPKYLGILVHEIFHYAAPLNRSKRNAIITKCLCRVALVELINMISYGQASGTSKQYGNTFYKDNKNLCDHIVDRITTQIMNSDKRMHTISSNELEEVLMKYLKFTIDPTKPSYGYYFKIWSMLRIALSYYESSCTPEERIIGGLDVGNSEDSIEVVFSKLVQSFRLDDIKYSHQILSNCYRALGELPPDIFDVSFVLHGESHQTKLEQYLWQIHGVQRDFTSGSIHSSTQYAYLDITTLRMGFFLDYYLGFICPKNGEGALASCLRHWGEATGKYLGKFNKIKDSFIRNYAVYYTHSFSYSDVAMELCAMVADEIEALEKNEICVEIIEKLTNFYRRYYQGLDNLQKGRIDNDSYINQHFSLCCEIINAYQHQDSIQAVCNISASSDEVIPIANVPTQAPVAYNWKEEFSSIAYDSASLSMSINSAYKAMSVNNVMPVFWYRGQRCKSWHSLPNIMRITPSNSRIRDTSFAHLLKEELRWARAKILPTGNDFSKADWLAFLQHNGFKTSVLDFSESFYPSLFFAIEEWDEDHIPTEDACITLFNPVLFNLAMESLEAGALTNSIKHYLKTGYQEKADHFELPLFATQEELRPYEYLFDWLQPIRSNKEKKYPRAALVPKNCDRMEKQSGQFVFYDLQSEMEQDSQTGKFSYDSWSLENLHAAYINLFGPGDKQLMIPFMYRIQINHKCYKDFKEYLQVIGINKYQVYPELDKLAEDLLKQLRF